MGLRDQGKLSKLDNALKDERCVDGVVVHCVAVLQRVYS
jgi:hypothetical protein